MLAAKAPDTVDSWASVAKVLSNDELKDSNVFTLVLIDPLKVEYPGISPIDPERILGLFSKL